MFTFYFDETSRINRYVQLTRHIRQLIMGDELKSGMQLPSRRQLAEHLRISVTTVDLAYQQLVAEGFVVSKPRSGFFVRDLIRLTSPNFPDKEINHSTLKEQTSYKHDFKTNLVDPNYFPYMRLAKLEKETILDDIREKINEQDLFGYDPLRNEIASYLRRYRGIQADPAQILIGTGSETMVTLVRGIFGSDAVVALENPGVPRIQKLYEAYGIRTCPISIDSEGIHPDELVKNNCTLCHVTPSHQFPTGIVMPITRRLALLEWVNKSSSRFLIEDDYDSEFRFGGNPIPALSSLDREGRVIYMNSFTKSMAPTLRINFLVLPPILVQRYRQVFLGFSSPVSLIAQVSLARFMKQGWFESHLNRMKQLYRQKRDRLIASLKTGLISDRIRIVGEDAGLHFLMEINADLHEKDVINAAQEAGIRIDGLSETALVPLQEKACTLVLGYSGLTDVEQAADALKQVIDKLIH
ncbi:MAG: PLP-dependent aminotransferase family protein [Candidatus Izemoplasmatales bacterium]|nr:PLP-dependent aminotransferase family protein [Candidatus Izemoplasmatales bacterium]MDY0374036.1 PLP-dependent aminotransferase family protein [Candidatus Izemoplasmatales bacterium]